MDAELEEMLRKFVSGSAFATRGAVITDLDGTAVLEHEGRVTVAPEVEFGLKHLSDLGQPVAINTLRFPLNVIRTFGRAWAKITDKPLPLVSLNGAITGYLQETVSGTAVFEEIDAVTLTAAEIEEVLVGARGMVAEGVAELLLFHYPRDWTAGEIIWTPDPARVEAVRSKYASASEVFAGSVEGLEERLNERDVCMIFLLVEIPQDRLMAYQHARPSSFVTHEGVDKLAGSARLAAALDFDLAQSIGAGDTPMDAFLSGCGLALHVGPLQLEHKGLLTTLRVPSVPELAEVLQRLAALQREAVS